MRNQYYLGDTSEHHKQTVGELSYTKPWLGRIFGTSWQNLEQRRDFQLRRGLDHKASVWVHRGLVDFLTKRYRRTNIEAHLPRSWYRSIEDYIEVLSLNVVDNSVRHAHQILHSAHMQDLECGLTVTRCFPVGRPN